MLQDNTPDAAESSAGDDFHILWSIQKCLKLINFSDDGLQALSVENLSSADRSYLDTSGGMNLGVDLTEYYGGNNILEAKKVIVSQLKYSTRTPDKDWTAARICTSRKGVSDGSIIDRLATFYSKLSDQVDRKMVLDKLTLKLVSNRPASKTLISAITSSKIHIGQSREKVGLKDITAKLNAQEKKEIERLFAASKLTEIQFPDFISVLDFSDCNQGSRFELEQQIISAISKWTAFTTSLEYNYLHKLVWGKMMTEQKQINTIFLSDVILAFNLHDISAIFPVNNKIYTPEKLVIREQVVEIMDELVYSASQIVCLHGGAGIGKSTIVNIIPELLPPHSVAIVFDCYGGGSYLDPEDRRHKHEAGILQICNELALKSGSNLLLSVGKPDEFYLKQLKERMGAAISIIRSINPDAILSIVLDAADNSVTASEVYGGRAFVRDLVAMEFPEGCKIVVSARTERVHLLELPQDAAIIPIKPFSQGETRTFLEGYFDDVTEEQVSEFRKLTHATPRVMSYALELPGTSLNEKLEPLKPNGKTLEQIFKFRIRDTERKSSNKEVTSLLKTMIAMPRPVPLGFITSFTNLTEESIHDIHIDLWREILRNGSEFTFRDEDFETFLRNTYKIGLQDYTGIAETLLASADQNDYASSHLANFLGKSGKYAELREIVIDKKFLDYPLDPVRNKEVFIERAKTAMRMATSEFDPEDFIRLQIVSAEAAKTNSVLEDILLDKPDLAAKYGNLQTNQKIYFQSGNPGWFGRVHYRNAAIYARQKDTWDQAKQHLRKAREWLDYRKRLEEEECKDYRLHPADLAFGAEAILHIFGVDEAIKWLRGWKPKHAMYSVLSALLNNLFPIGLTAPVDCWLKKNGDSLRVDIRLLIVKIYFSNGAKVPLNLKQVLSDSLHLSRIKGKEEQLLNSLIACCEGALASGISYEEVKPILGVVTFEWRQI
jgi:energy-coupling factor transporter ATP-binding protein EcfA2